MTGHIQVGDVAPRVQYVANGSQTVFPYPFPIFTESDLDVWIGAARLAAATYVVAGAGSSEGGSVTLTVPPANGAIVTLRRRLTLRRTSDFHDDGIIRAKVVNDEFDYQTMSVQQVAEEVERAVRRAHTSSSNADLTLPDPVPGRAIKWNAAASGLENSAFDVDQVLAQAMREAAEAEASAALASVSAATATARAAEATSAASTATAAADQAVALVGFTIDTDPTLATSSDEKIATQKAVRTYVDTTVPAALDPVRGQIALTNLRLLLNSSVASGLLLGGRQWELATDEWAAGSSGASLTVATPNYYTNLASIAESTSALLHTGGWSGSTWINLNTKLPNATLVTSLRFYLDCADTGAVAKIVKRNSAGNYDVVFSSALTYVAPGWNSLATAFSVPATGNYYIGLYHTASYSCYLIVPRAHYIGNAAAGAGLTMSEGDGDGAVPVGYTALRGMTLLSPPLATATVPSHASLYALYRDDSGTATLGADLAVEISRDGGASYTNATIVPLATYDGSYALIRARADLSGQPAGTSLVARIKTDPFKAQRIAAPALYAE
ncbi:hypothetical protein [Magnetospirillum fulvum]|uniref:Uncharacterized protein n=1 Tax=Magnetospirillum fulvum TaxID=1082 RepID=A0A1H6I890_MAGFU|nr:hypothetical protein [Magnetospirillum fulvum]SEH45354.1 hypothetical protein SAMN04244559_02407 [Magnetospirillum fulvum]